jgi:predicted CXXCH cytochrome family protein
VRLRILLAGMTIFVCAATARAQVAGDVMGMHNLGPGSTSHITGARPDSCAYCHAPHSGVNMGLWNQKLTTQSYTMYTPNTSKTVKNSGVQPAIASSSNMCLSCHDGTVAVGSTVAYGQITMMGSMNPVDVFSDKMQTSHPFSLALPMKDNSHLVSTLATNGKTADSTGAVKLINGSVECTSCHNPHVQAKDMVAQKFLVRDGSAGQVCLSCHDPARTTSGQLNPLADWPTSAHATSGNKIQGDAHLGSYPTVAGDACITCHTPHNAGSGARLLRGQDEQTCISCHNGPTKVDMAPNTNVFIEYQSPRVGHPFPTSTNPHDAAEDTLLNSNRHATCVDCHSGHGSQPVQAFPAAPLIRVSQKNVLGINASDGTSVRAPAVNQYENCLRCHGASAGKQVLPIYGYFPVRAVSAGDPLNLIRQFVPPNLTLSSHPVMHPRSSFYPQPSLLPNMMNLDGLKQGRAMGTQILCTDCHNSDDNRESGGTGANGPHGSRWSHILERRYEFSQASTPGLAITTLFPPDMSATGPYAMCAKCHDLANQIMKDTSWNRHSEHINAGFSCSVCHTAHGIGATSSTISGQRLVNFDLNVVAPNAGNPISYNRATNSCVLVCHGHAHNAGGSGSNVRLSRGPVGVRN